MEDFGAQFYFSIILRPLYFCNSTLVLQPLLPEQTFWNTTLELQPLLPEQTLWNSTLVLQPLPFQFFLQPFKGECFQLSKWATN